MEIDWSEWETLGRNAFELVVAAILGGLVGFEREHTGKAAGLRTHMLVAVGAALSMIVPREMGIDANSQSRVIEGIVSGVGFLGAGAILKLSTPPEIHGLTTAAGIWVTAAIGLAVGAGAWPTALVAVLVAWLVLAAVRWLEPSNSARA